MFSRLVFSILIFPRLAPYDCLIRLRERRISAPWSLLDARLIRPGTSSAIRFSAPSHCLRKFPHSPVIRQLGFRIRLFWFPFHWLTHYQPPHECYIELFEPTATKC